MVEEIAIDASPLIALGKMDLLEMVNELPLTLLVPDEVCKEVRAGFGEGHLVDIPNWVEIYTLRDDRNPAIFDRLDSGEAAVIQLAIELGGLTVCLDENKGRRVAREFGLDITGSLGILAKAKSLGYLRVIKPSVVKALENGIFYDENLLQKFLSAVGE